MGLEGNIMLLLCVCVCVAVCICWFVCVEISSIIKYQEGETLNNAFIHYTDVSNMKGRSTRSSACTGTHTPTAAS